MQIVDPGHLYKLNTLDGDGEKESLRFVKREGLGYPGNEGHYPGTNLQEVLRVLIDRVKYLDKQEHDYANTRVLYHLRHAIIALEIRAAHRHNRPLVINDPETVELMATCSTCGHVGHQCP